jgi:2,4'-dihydroxyacetophenone dioxygenase
MTLAPSTSSPVTDSDSLPWAPLGPGFSFKVLRALPDDRVRVLLLRAEPGTLIPRHRHSGEVHAFNIAGYRKLLETGEVVGPGGYVHEPVGNVDSWLAVGDEPVIIHVVVEGTVEYLDEHDQATSTSTNASSLQTYQRHCATCEAPGPSGELVVRPPGGSDGGLRP